MVADLRNFVERHYFPLVVVIVLVALSLRLQSLELADNRDFDEGVYLQSLMAMASGHTLYSEIFYSQPPAFLLSVYPFFVVFGQNLWAARFGIATISLIALPAAALLGHTIGGRTASLLAVGLVAFDPLYLKQSQILQAEVPQMALSFLSVSIAMRYARHRNRITAMVLPLLAGLTATYSTLCKLFGISTFFPLLIVVSQIAFGREKPRRVLVALLAGLLGAVVALAIFGLPYVGSLQALWQQAVQFHLDASKAYQERQPDNLFNIAKYLVASPLSYAAIFGIAMTRTMEKELVLPLVGWFLVTLVLLINHKPLFAHHLVTLQLPLIALATLSLSRDRTYVPLSLPFLTSVRRFYSSIPGLVILAYSASADAVSFFDKRSSSVEAANINLMIARDIAQAIDDESLAITDCQLVPALAQRRTPAGLVDTSFVRIRSQYLSTDDLVAGAEHPDVKVVLFCSGRLSLPEIKEFRTFVEQRFLLLHTYPPAGAFPRELWIKSQRTVPE